MTHSSRPDDEQPQSSRQGPNPLDGYGQQAPMSKQEAKARAAAARAYERSRRNWFGRHKLLTVLGALVVLVVVIVIATSMSGNNTKTSNSAGAGATAANIGTPVRDGKFEFTVATIDPGVSTIGTDPLTATAQGQFVLVHLTVRNIGDQQQLLDQSAQQMIDQRGRQLSSAPGDAFLVDPQNFLAEINPGNSVDGVLVFDIPTDSVPTKLVLHDSVFSNGVTVPLR